MAKRTLPLGGAIPVEPGERDKFVRVQQLTEGKATSGFPTEVWTPLRQIWFSKRDEKGSERYVNNELSGPVVTRWECGYAVDMDPDRLDVTKTRRLVYQDRIYDITDASLIGRNEGIELVTLTAKRTVTA